MELSYLTELVGDIAVITTILQFMSGALVCKRYVINRTTGETSPLPFISCVLSCMLWLFYGVVKGDNKIMLVNLVGVLLMITYTVVFSIFTLKKSVVMKQVLASSVVLFFVCGVIIIKQDDRATLLNVLGVIASMLTLATVSAPMSKLFYVIKVKNTDCLPFPMIVMSFLVSSSWTMYGYLLQDDYIVCVNIIGAAITIAQLSLFLVYPSMPESPLLPKHI